MIARPSGNTHGTCRRALNGWGSDPAGPADGVRTNSGNRTQCPRCCHPIHAMDGVLARVSEKQSQWLMEVAQCRRSQMADISPGVLWWRA